MNRPGQNAHWDELIARYFAGLTTDEEERRLRRFLASPDSADARYDETRAVMGFLAVGRQLHTPHDLQHSVRPTGQGFGRPPRPSCSCCRAEPAGG